MNNREHLYQTKDELRRSMKGALRAVLPEQRAVWSSQIVEHLMEEESWVPPAGGVVAMFGGMASEPDLLALLPWLTERRVLAAFFLIEDPLMTPHLVRSVADLHARQMGVLEPDASRCEALPVEELGAVLVPGLAFDRRSGVRLGRGKGYYDRVLAGLLPESSRRLGVCFDLQVQDTVPSEAHDMPMQAVITEQGWIRMEDV